MAGTPSGSDKKAKRGTARLRFLRRRSTLIPVVAVLMVGGACYLSLAAWLGSVNDREHGEGTRSIERGEYKQGFEQLKAVDQRGGTEEKTGEKSYTYYLELARAAYLAGDNEAAKRYAEQGIEQLPPEDSDAYFTAQSAALHLYDIRDGRYQDHLEYEAGMPLAGEER